MARSSPGVLRVAAILNFIADHPGQSFTLTDLVRALKLSRATCHALLTGLVEVGYLYRASDKNYVLGPALMSIGRVAQQHSSPLQVAQPEMRALADEFDVVCTAFFREGDELVLRDRAASVSHVGWSESVGTRVPVRPPFASLFYAWTPPIETDKWLDAFSPRPTPKILSDMQAGMAFLRENGFQILVRNPASPGAHDAKEQALGGESGIFPTVLANSIDLEKSYHLDGVVAPVFELDGKILFVLGLVGFNRSVSGADGLLIGARLCEACDRITTFITGRRPQDTSRIS